MIDISGRFVRAGIRSFTAVATASCFVVTPQVTSIASAHTKERAARAHDHTTPRPDHDGHTRDRGRGRADVVVDTKGPKGKIVPGRTYEWPFEVTNRGTAPAKDVALTARPNRNLKVLAAPPKCRWRHAGPLVCDIGLLPQGHTKRGVITAAIVPRAHGGKALTDPIQVSWRTARRERLMAAFPPVEVPPGTGGTSAAPAPAAAPAAAPASDGKVPYPLMVTEHGPVTAESVVVRSPIGLPAPEGPCAAGVAPREVPGGSEPAKPSLGACGAEQDDPAACGCRGVHEAPAATVPGVAVPDRPAAAPCGAVARPVAIPDRPAVPPCAQHRPVAPPPVAVERPASEPAAPCGAMPARPAAGPDRPLLPPCAQTGPAAWVDEPAAAPCGVLPARPATAAGRPALPPCAGPEPITKDVAKDVAKEPAKDGAKNAVPVPVAVDRPAPAPCHAAADRPVILPAPVGAPAAVPGSPCGAVADRPGAVKADQPVTGKPADTTPVATTTDKPADEVADRTEAKPAEAAKDATAEDKAKDEAAKEKAAREKAAQEKAAQAPGADKAAEAPAATPCGASAANPGVVPGRPVTVPQVPAIPPCAQARPARCGCLASQNAPAAPAAEPVTPAVPDSPVAAPCAAGADTPVATGKAAPEGPACGQDAPAAVHEEPAATPDTIEPMTPLTGPGKSAHEPLGRPHHHVPLGRPHHGCTRQGEGFICPLGSAAHRRPPVLNLHAPSHPRGLHCVGASGMGCHTREARPVAVRPQPVRGNLPTTGSSSALLALSGLGLAGAGMVLYRLSRTRTRREEG
jgi:LPXTG-motif cell wall-anchored protein